MSFASRFPKVAALLASTAARAPAAEEDDEDRGTGRGADKGVDQGALEAAFEKDAGELVSAAVKAERTRWSAVLESDEAKANIVAATTLLADTDMDADKVKATVKKMGPAAKAPATRGANDGDDDERQPERGADADRRDRRGRLQRGAEGTDKDTGGAGGKDRSGSDELEPVRERRRSMQEQRNRQAQRGAGGAGRKAAAGSKD